MRPGSTAAGRAGEIHTLGGLLVGHEALEKVAMRGAGIGEREVLPGVRR
jgi:hypothetical protein